MSEKSRLCGKERLVRLKFLGREIRVGSARELSVPDFHRVRQALRSREAASARSYLNYIHTQWLGMSDSYLEWILAWSDFVEARHGPEASILTASTAYASWRRAVTASAAEMDDEAVRLLLGLLNYGQTEYLAGNAGRRTSSRALLGRRLNDAPNGVRRRILQSVEERRFAQAGSNLNRYFTQIRQRHDLLAAYVWAYASAVDQRYGQAAAQEGLIWSLSQCSFFDVWWRLATSRSPEEVALLVAEELRGHFSGPDRLGSVTIVNNPNYYLLVFDPCGSGGAMRRVLGNSRSDGLRNFEEATPATWGRKGEVPIYCAHCAQNELTSIQRVGYPIWVTEFDTDPDMPCGWRIYKDPALIPTRYFSRLGITKDDLRFEGQSAETQKAAKEASKHGPNRSC